MAFKVGDDSPSEPSLCWTLIFSQMLTLYITPVIYGYLDRLGKFAGRGSPRDVEIPVQAE